MASFAAVVFWSALLLILYVFAGYALVLRLWAALRRPAAGGSRDVSPAAVPPGEPPLVSVLLPVHDEAGRIAARLDNLLALDYPPQRLEILVGSDGSADDTPERAERFRERGVRVFAFPARRGKAAVLADLARQARGGILVFADARQRFDPGVVRALVGSFGDPDVGAVTGELIPEAAAPGEVAGEGLGFYWRRETSIRRLESRIDSVVGATGAIYAVRAALFPALPPDTILDDVLIPMHVVRRGFRVEFQPAARAYDRPPGSGRGEFLRKARTIAGNFQLFVREPWLLDPRRNRLWLQTVSHKGLRLLLPFLFGALLLSSLALARNPLHRAALIAQAGFYAAALAGALLRRPGRGARWLSLPYVVCLLNGATLLGLARFVCGRQNGAWERVNYGSFPGSYAGDPPPVGTRRDL